MSADDRDRTDQPAEETAEPVEDRISSRIGGRTGRPGDPDPADPGATSPVDVQEDTMTIPTTSDEAAPTPGDAGPAVTTPMPTTPAAAERSSAPAAEPAPARAPRRSVRVGTIVWGLVIAAIGAFIMAYALDVKFDTELAFIVLLGAAGLLLLVGSLVTSRRRR